MSIYDEIKNYSAEDLHLIITTQRDLYTEEEMAEIESRFEDIAGFESLKRIEEKRSASAINEQFGRKSADKIACPKCGGPNDFGHEKCVFCSATLDKSLSYSEPVNESEDEEIQSEEEDKKENLSRFFLSFIIPIVGFIIGGILIASREKESARIGKICVIIAAVSSLVCVLLSLLSSIALLVYLLILFI